MKYYEEILVFFPLVPDSLDSGRQESDDRRRNKLGPLWKPERGLIFWQETWNLSYHFSGEIEA